MRWQDVPIPDSMKNLSKDKRGYPIPASVQVDPDGTPHFALNPEQTRQRLLRENCCSICGKKLLRGRWFAGGPVSAFYARGVYQDPPVHYECGRYALQVCPYLVLPNYLKQVSTKSIERRDFDSINVVYDSTRIRIRPDPFVFVMAVGQSLTYSETGQVRFVIPKRPYRRVEYWSNGVQLEDHVGVERVGAYFEEHRELFADPSLWERPEHRIVTSSAKRRET